MTKQETLQERSARLNQAALKDTKDYATESYYKGFSMNKPKEQTPAVPKITLEHSKTYVTAGGSCVTVYSKRVSDDFYKFEGSNGYNYGVNGKVFENSNADSVGFNIVSKYYGRIFSTAELQSLTKMQSKVITALEAEILELKETAAYLGHTSNSRVQELSKKIYNEITTKKKRLAKLVELQQKMKRSK